MSRAEFYRLVSSAISRARGKTLEQYGVDMVVSELAFTFAQHNTKFDADRFRQDCQRV